MMSLTARFQSESVKSSEGHLKKYTITSNWLKQISIPCRDLSTKRKKNNRIIYLHEHQCSSVFLSRINCEAMRRSNEKVQLMAMLVRSVFQFL